MRAGFFAIAIENLEPEVEDLLAELTGLLPELGLAQISQLRLALHRPPRLPIRVVALDHLRPDGQLVARQAKASRATSSVSPSIS
jgi:hypothetical protein